ncbi:MAG: hypothetical protein ABSG65_17795 [Bryobacteraceae bacterium]
MNRAYICFYLLAVSLVSAFGQEHPRSVRTRPRGFWGAARPGR